MRRGNISIHGYNLEQMSEAHYVTASYGNETASHNIATAAHCNSSKKYLFWE
jgi:hypothetical protein